MQLSKYAFIVLAIIVIIIIAMVSGSLSSTVLTLALTVNFIALSTQLEKVHMKFSKFTDPEVEVTEDGRESAYQPNGADPSRSIYDDYNYDKWNEQRQQYSQHEVAAEQIDRIANETDVPVHGGGVDAAAVRMSQCRARDRAVIKGRLNKTADYYKYYFDNELDETEKRIWWGEYDS